MNDLYLNGPSEGGAMSAEEYAAALAASGPVSLPPGPSCPLYGGQGCGCGCGGTGTGREYGGQLMCCCQIIPDAAPVVPAVEEGCCCKQSFRTALQLLCSTEVAGLLDFEQTAFLTDEFLAGGGLYSFSAPAAGESADNLSAPLTGSFRRFSPCSCDLLDISATPYYPTLGANDELPFTVSQVSLCQLSAVVIQGAEGVAEGDLTVAEATARNFRLLKRRLAARLNPCGASCGQCSCSCDCQDCCCSAGLMAALSSSNLSRRVTLTAGYLAVVNVELLGSVGNVLVLASDDTQRIYFVCVNKVQLLA